MECSSSRHWVSGQIHHAESPTGRARHSAAQDLSRNPESAGKRLSPEHATASSLFAAQLLTSELRSFITYPHSFTFIPHPFHPLSLFPSMLLHSCPPFPLIPFHPLSPFFHPPPSSFILPSTPFLLPSSLTPFLPPSFLLPSLSLPFLLPALPPLLPTPGLLGRVPSCTQRLGFRLESQ